MSKVILGLNCRTRLNGNLVQASSVTFDPKNESFEITNQLSGGNAEFVLTTTITELTIECMMAANDFLLYLPPKTAMSFSVAFDPGEASGFTGFAVLLEAPLVVPIKEAAKASFKLRTTGPITKLGGSPTYTDGLAT